MNYKICVIKGDGIGPDVIDSALEVLNAVGFEAEYTEAEAGFACYKKHGTNLPKETLEKVKESDATLFGAITTPTDNPKIKSAIVQMRQELDLYANLRPAKSYEGTPFVKEMDMFIVRENTEGMYSGIEERNGDRATATRVVTKEASAKIVRYGFNLAKELGEKKLTIVHKSNIMKLTCGLFKETAEEVAKEFSGIELEEVLVDAMAMRLVKHPENFRVIVTTNLFGDILSDEATQIAGGLGLAASGNIGEENAIFEPVHGSAPKYAGKNIANPLACVLSAKMMLEWLGEKEKAKKIQNTIEELLREQKVLSKDLGGTASTTEVTKELVKKLEEK